MADQKLTELDAATSVAGTDLTYGVVSGTQKKVAFSKVKDYILGLANTWTGKQTVPQLTLAGDVSASAWTTSGVGIGHTARTLTDTSSSGTVAAAYTNVLGGNTIAASNANTVYTEYGSLYIGSPAAGTNVAITNSFSLVTAGSIKSGAKVAANFGYTFGQPQFYDASFGTGVGFGISSIAECVIYSNSSAIFAVSSNSTGVRINNTTPVSWTNSHALSTADLYLTRKAAASLQLGAADAAAPVAQTIGPQSVVAGTSNTAGATFTIRGSQGTGTGAGGSIVFQVAPAGSSGTSQNALASALTIDSTKLATFADGIKTAAPTGGTSGTWKLGVKVDATTTLDTAKYLEVDVGGTLYKVALVTT